MQLPTIFFLCSKTVSILIKMQIAWELFSTEICVSQVMNSWMDWTLFQISYHSSSCKSTAPGDGLKKWDRKYSFLHVKKFKTNFKLKIICFIGLMSITAGF